MSELAFQYIGFGCVFLAALRVMDFICHVIIGMALSWTSINRYYIIAVDALNRTTSVTELVTSTGTAQHDHEN